MGEVSSEEEGQRGRGPKRSLRGLGDAVGCQWITASELQRHWQRDACPLRLAQQDQPEDHQPRQARVQQGAVSRVRGH
eukprot:3616375-Rhodomonas_salina.1